MATVISGNQVKLNNGQTIQAQEGGWYDGQQLFGGSLSAPGVINAKSPQQGAGQAVSKEVVQQTNPANWQYIQQQQQVYKPSGGSQPMPSGSSGGSSGGTSGGGGGGGGVGITPAQPAFDPVQFYESQYAGSGIRDVEAQLTEKTNAYNTQIAKIKDNPYLSEATMTGRIKKLEEKFAADQTSVQNQIAMKKADIETQLNLQLKKLDINNAQTKMAWDQANSLLQMGALDNASGEDIANLTRSTGISSGMWQSAIDANKKKNAPKVSISNFDDGTNTYAVAIDENGNIVNRQVIGASKPDKTGKPTAKETEAEEAQQNQQSLITDIKKSLTPKELVPYYGQVLSIEEIYRLYNTYSPYGPAKETLDEFKQGLFVS